MKTIFASTVLYLAVMFFARPLPTLFFWVYTGLFIGLITIEILRFYVKLQIKKEEHQL